MTRPSIFVQKFNANDTITGQTLVQLEPIGRTNKADSTPQVTAIGSSGEYVVTWSGKGSTGGDTSIFVQKFNVDGTPAHQTPVQLEAVGSTKGDDTAPQITAVGSSGEYVVTWSGKDSAGGDTSIFVQKFNADGTPAHQTPVQLEAFGSTKGDDEVPQVTAVGNSGEYVVSWSGQDNTGGDTSIFVQKFKADGTPAHQTPVQLEAIGRADGDDYAPQITAVGSSGEYVVTWHGLDSARDTSIFVQKFSADGQVIPGITAVGNVGVLTVRSSENGMAYLVNTSVNVGVLTDITNAADNLWNVVTISSAQTDTALPTTGLLAGNYALYTADEAGNLSLAVTSIEVVGVATV